MTDIDGDKRLQTDCRQCVGLCCIVLPHRAGAGFPAAKVPDWPCSHLDEGFRCRIHDSLAQHGYTVCPRYDCRGAGVLVSRFLEPGPAEQIAEQAERLEDFRQLSRLHQVIWALMSVDQPGAEALRGELLGVSEAYERLGIFKMTQSAQAELARNAGLIEDILNGYSTNVESENDEQA
ncbi:MAG: hypothetical protein HOL85_09670 [Rhodospirillaceae bacterium]|nr:hypothetical protein [Rhodospirillaceae bacterium]MBT6136248.1 hypothetical protein [Rhodospirillaceae bacterium]